MEFFQRLLSQLLLNETQEPHLCLSSRSCSASGSTSFTFLIRPSPLGDNHVLYVTAEVDADHSDLINRITNLDLQ
jgi:hypothetical protein